MRLFVIILIITFCTFSSFLQGAVQKAPKPEKKAKTYILSQATKQNLLAEMIWVEGGSFDMGSDLPTALNREKPVHSVKLTGFYIGKTEVTQVLFKELMGWDVSYFTCATCPVNNVSWFNVQLFIERLNKATGKNFRLPTEAEWEYAARGGQHSKNYLYSGSNNINNVAWYVNNAEKKVHPVALKNPNELGLYDMTGNLWEFCHDDMSRFFYKTSPLDNPIFLKSDDLKQKSLKVIRGSGYEFNASESEISRRDGATNNVRMPDIGFRLVMDKD